MRDIFVQDLLKAAKINPAIILLTADLGFKVFDEFIEACPDQFLNVGICEQAMIGIASGLALEGHKVFCYSIGNFPTLRCLEQIRNDACYHNLDITIVSVGVGFSYGQLGMSHFASEDLSVLSALPNISIYSPSSLHEMHFCFSCILESSSPKYLRIDKSSHSSPPLLPLKFGHLSLLQDGIDVCIIATSGICSVALSVSSILSKHDLNISVYSMPFVKPMNSRYLVDELSRYQYILTLEEGVLRGGIGSLISHMLIQSSSKILNFRSFGLPDSYPSIVGDQEFLRKYYKLDAFSISSFILSVLE